VLGLMADARAEQSEIITRISDSGQRYWVEEITAGLTFPSSMTWLPNGDMLIAERTGNIRVLSKGKLNLAPLNGVPTSYQGPTNYSPGAVLSDILLDVDFAANQSLYLVMSEGTTDAHHLAVFRARYTAAGLTDAMRIWRASNDVGGYVYIGSRMIFLADKTLLVSVPESAHDGAQQLSSYKGKIIRINRDGSIPKDNPFLNTPGALPEIWSYGHRIPLGLYLEYETGMVWEVESGPRGGDELNLLKARGNYGWARASWGFAYGNNGLEAPLQSGVGIEDPVLIWTPSVTPSGLTRARGHVYPRWDRDYFLGYLTSKALQRLRIEGRRVLVQERMLEDLEERIRDVRIGSDNHVYLLTDHENGRVLRLNPGSPRADKLARVARKLKPTPATLKIEAAIDTAEDDNHLKGQQAFIERCAGCHRVGTVIAGERIGPDLAGVHGRGMGRRTDFAYSSNMADSPVLWSSTTLDLFLTDPGGFVPGTTMAAAPVTDPQTRRNIINFLKQH
jgi:glucose/arabinose dehydrogenase/cytochrome c2